MDEHKLKDLVDETNDELQAMMDDYGNMVEVQHGPKVRKMVETMIMGHSYVRAMAKICAVTEAPGVTTALVGVTTAKFCSSVVNRALSDSGLEDCSEQDIEAWNELATRFVNNTEALVKNMVEDKLE
jgi:hypothetical protein